jgi:hypothetical protein
LHTIFHAPTLPGTMMKRIAIYVLTFAFVVGTTLQTVPRADAMSAQPGMAMADMTGMADGHQPLTPCKGLTPTCLDRMGCVINLAVPMMPPPNPVSVRWAAVSYSSTVTPLTGVSTEPELSPPILRA